MDFGQIWKLIMTFLGDNVEISKLLFAVIGGGFALLQWGIQIKHKKAEIVKELICKVRDDDDIAAIMDIIDWNEGLRYNGKFYIDEKYNKPLLANENSDSLAKKIDKTFSHYSYI